MLTQPKLEFKAGATIELTVSFGFDGGSGINSLDGVALSSQIRRAHSDFPEAELSVQRVGSTAVWLVLDSAQSARLRPGDYVVDVAFRRESDGYTEYSGDLKIKIVRETTRVK